MELSVWKHLEPSCGALGGYLEASWGILGDLGAILWHLMGLLDLIGRISESTLKLTPFFSQKL